MGTPDWTAAAHLPLADWKPRYRLVVAGTVVARTAVTAIDAHNHLGRWLSDDGDWISATSPRSSP